MDFAPEQLRAVEYCCDTKRRVVAISGQAGTGKTTIIQRAVDDLRKRKRNVILAAPTGRAARRIYEATGFPAITIHKLLEYGKPEVDEETGEPKHVTHPARHRDNPIDYMDVFVDEYAMVNEELHRNLLDALPPGGRLLAFGDAAQLPPIEEYELTGMDGSPFERLLRLPSSVILTQVYRQAGDSGILYNATRIRNGIAPVRKPDFEIKISDIPVKDLREHVYKALQNGIDYSSVANQVISPARKGKLGVHSLNSFLQAIFHPNDSDGLPLPREKWLEKHPVNVHVGEKVICNENIYDLRDFFERFERYTDDDEPIWSTFIPCPDNFSVLNGEIGTIVEILPDGGLDIDFGDRIVHMPAHYRDYIPKFNRVVGRDPRKKLDLAYAVTTHKMQGSECDHVTLVLHSAISPNINRNNIYTAVTRAKHTVHIISDSRMLASGVKLTAAEKSKIMAKAKSDNQGWKVGDTAA